MGVKPPSTMVLSQAEPNPSKFSIETDLRSHYVRPYMSPPPKGAELGGDYMSSFSSPQPLRMVSKPPSTMLLGQSEPNPFKLSIETSLRNHCMMVQKTPSAPARDTQPKSKVKPEGSLESKGLNVLSLCDGMGCGALVLKAKKIPVNRYVGVEIDSEARNVCDATNPSDGDFPGVDHTWFKDVTKITEKDIEALGPDYFDLVMWGSPCEDFSKLRLLPNRPGHKSRRRKKGVDPRPGLMGKHGRLLLVCCQVFKWVLKYSPKAKGFAENVDFSDVPKDWEEACLVFNELGSAGPHVINAAFHSCTKRNRACWTMNWDVPPDFELPCPPKLDADECVDEGRSIRRYNASAKPHFWLCKPKQNQKRTKTKTGSAKLKQN